MLCISVFSNYRLVLRTCHVADFVYKNNQITAPLGNQNACGKTMDKHSLDTAMIKMIIIGSASGGSSPRIPLEN